MLQTGHATLFDFQHSLLNLVILTGRLTGHRFHLLTLIFSSATYLYSTKYEFVKSLYFTLTFSQFHTYLFEIVVGQ